MEDAKIREVESNENSKKKEVKNEPSLGIPIKFSSSPSSLDLYIINSNKNPDSNTRLGNKECHIPKVSQSGTFLSLLSASVPNDALLSPHMGPSNTFCTSSDDVLTVFNFSKDIDEAYGYDQVDTPNRSSDNKKITLVCGKIFRTISRKPNTLASILLEPQNKVLLKNFLEGFSRTKDVLPWAVNSSLRHWASKLNFEVPNDSTAMPYLKTTQTFTSKGDIEDKEALSMLTEIVKDYVSKLEEEDPLNIAVKSLGSFVSFIADAVIVDSIEATETEFEVAAPSPITRQRNIREAYNETIAELMTSEPQWEEPPVEVTQTELLLRIAGFHSFKDAIESNTSITPSGSQLNLYQSTPSNICTTAITPIVIPTKVSGIISVFVTPSQLSTICASNHDPDSKISLTLLASSASRHGVSAKVDDNGNLVDDSVGSDTNWEIDRNVSDLIVQPDFRSLNMAPKDEYPTRTYEDTTQLYDEDLANLNNILFANFHMEAQIALDAVSARRTVQLQSDVKEKENLEPLIDIVTTIGETLLLVQTEVLSTTEINQPESFQTFDQGGSDEIKVQGKIKKSESPSKNNGSSPNIIHHAICMENLAKDVETLKSKVPNGPLCTKFAVTGAKKTPNPIIEMQKATKTGTKVVKPVSTGSQSRKPMSAKLMGSAKVDSMVSKSSKPVTRASKPGTSSLGRLKLTTSKLTPTSTQRNFDQGKIAPGCRRIEFTKVKQTVSYRQLNKENLLLLQTPARHDCTEKMALEEEDSDTPVSITGAGGNFEKLSHVQNIVDVFVSPGTTNSFDIESDIIIRDREIHKEIYPPSPFEDKLKGAGMQVSPAPKSKNHFVSKIKSVASVKSKSSLGYVHMHHQKTSGHEGTTKSVPSSRDGTPKPINRSGITAKSQVLTGNAEALHHSK